MIKKSILFVCTGNIFRSLSAEYAFKKYLSDNNIKGWKVSSAGIIAKEQSIDPKTLEVIKSLGIEKINHKQRKLTKKILNDYNIIVGMAKKHVTFIKKLDKEGILFNELALNKKTSILDVGDVVKDPLHNRNAVEEFIEETIKDIFKKIPLIYKKVSKIL